MSVPDHYRLLGLAPNASQREIRTAYRQALLRHHPDTNAGRRDSEEMLRRVLTAGRILGNPRERAKYDRSRLGVTPPSTATTAPAPIPVRPKGQLGWHKILRRWSHAGRSFLTGAWAEWIEKRAMRRRQRQHTQEFDTHLKRAQRRTAANAYCQGTDGIYRQRRETHPAAAIRPKQTVLWLMLGFIFKMVGRF